MTIISTLRRIENGWLVHMRETNSLGKDRWYEVVMSNSEVVEQLIKEQKLAKQ